MLEEGVLISKFFGKGTKSKHIAFYLQTKDGDVLVRKIGDNPFENNELVDFENKRVRIIGNYTEYGFFLIEEIETII